MTHERLNAVLAIGDRVCLWILVAGAAWTLSFIATQAELHSPTLIAPICIDVPTKAAK